ncbi:hypothetical protein BpHYR1_012941 [Brachionus plicatilis]|uniref:Uncharacterized protein n=1 Tax=Brachionus plicatilis TaxID=10195 RepID=A0A3M7SP85_BRAPC|nr:hypothetical protein BpHYR1_012941 [Brachionus plicatilis]
MEQISKSLYLISWQKPQKILLFPKRINHKINILTSKNSAIVKKLIPRHIPKIPPISETSCSGVFAGLSLIKVIAISS